MLLIRCCVPLIICTQICLLWPSSAPAEGLSARCTVAEDSDSGQSRQDSDAVGEWFDRYDQIRRDAEMTCGDKLQSLLLAAKKPEKKNAALASRMISKYTISLSAMKELRLLPETRELHKGYIEYFRTARQFFTAYLNLQKAVPFTNKSLIQTRKNLENLDRKNKTLDEELRKKYIISKHKHS